jgi:hypothetical protein
VFYLLFALRHGLDTRVADTLVSLTLWTVAASIVAHGVTAQPLMRRYLVWRRRDPGAVCAGRCAPLIRSALTSTAWPVNSEAFDSTSLRTPSTTRC